MSVPPSGGEERHAAEPRGSVPTHPMISPRSEREARKGDRPVFAAPARTQPPPPTGPPVWDGPPPAGASPERLSVLDRVRALMDRVSIRWRLTITYGVLFFAAGVLLLFVIYMMVGWAINGAWPPVSLPDAPLAYQQKFQEEWLGWKHVAIDEARNALLSRSLLALAGVGILAVIIGYLVADRALKPIQQMTTTARKLSGTTLAHERIDLKGPNDELKELADTFDAMLTRLNVAFDTQRRFVANASHELRTP